MELAVALLSLLTIGTVGLAVLSRRAATRAGHHVDELESRDLLTGLPGRTLLMRELEARLATASSSAPLTVMLIELSRFAAINETYGHETGDALFAAVARRLGASPAVGDLLTRLSGPQLAMLSTDAGPDRAERRAADLLSIFESPVRLGTDNIRVGASIGIVCVDRPGTAAEATLSDAATALRQAVMDGTNKISVYTPAMQGRVAPVLAEQQLQAALDGDQFWLFYLPVVELGTNKLVGAEALLRWADPEHGMIAPDQFMTALNDSGLIVPVGMWAIRKACEQAVDWNSRFPTNPLTMTVNVSPRQLMHSDFAADLARVLEDTGVNPEELCIEIAGGDTIYDVEAVKLSIHESKKLGIQLALDDFGIGNASLDYVRRFNIDVLKIERSFVSRLGDNREDLAIVQQLVGLGHALGITTVAEGVDSADQAEALIAMNCHFGQGYYWMKPQPADAMEAVIQRGRILPGQAAGGSSVNWSGTAG